MEVKPATTKGQPSSNLHSVGYDPETRTLAVRFLSGGKSGAIYHYFNVPKAYYDAMMDPDVSTGGYLHQHIKGAYEFKKQ